ncbi:MAG TPA: PTS fructose transporter subunit IIA [Myxococcales bacterium]|nr:PTS fructose transporter subunit IIA [Myxococcales bacterium]
MKITEFLHPDSVIGSLQASDKPGVMAELCEPLAKHVPGLSAERLAEVLIERERLSSTGIGEGVAIPHGKLTGLSGLVAAFGVSRDGIDFDAIDGKPTYLFFALLAPESSAGIHLKALARISRLFRNAAFRKAIVEAEDAKAIYDLIATEDAKA